jgi:CDP-6-deoxy-D-xylo-4-hexulose-3-dehydrase
VKIECQFAEPIFGDEERAAVNRVMQRKWLASSIENEEFEREFSEYIGLPFSVCVNSGSSANLLALASLNLSKGSNILTSACGFPATLSPILHLGFVPVLVDYSLPSHNIDVEQIIDKMDKVDAVILAHTMGVPVEMAPIMEAAEKYGVPVIEDCCEALSAIYNDKQVGSIGDLGTFSFYPSHQITALGGGGMVTCKDEKTFKRLRSLRDWGKASDWDKYTQNNTKYEYDVDGIPYFMHYVYETVGFNMKLPEANAAFGREQLKKAEDFSAGRMRNHYELWRRLSDCDDLLNHVTPINSIPSWFGYVLTLKEDSPVNRDKFGDYLEKHGVRHRPFFAGNITRHKPFSQYKQVFQVADYLMRRSLFVGCWPGLTDTDIEYMADVIKNGLIYAK